MIVLGWLDLCPGESLVIHLIRVDSKFFYDFNKLVVEHRIGEKNKWINENMKKLINKK